MSNTEPVRVTLDVDASGVAAELSDSLLKVVEEGLKKSGVGFGLIRSIKNTIEKNLPKEVLGALNSSFNKISSEGVKIAEKAGEKQGRAFAQGETRAQKAARREQEAIARETLASLERIAVQGTQKASQVRLSENAKVRREAQRTEAAKVTADAKITASDNKLAGTKLASVAKITSAQIAADARVKASDNDLTATKLSNQTKIARAQIVANAGIVRSRNELAAQQLRSDAKIQQSEQKTRRERFTQAAQTFRSQLLSQRQAANNQALNSRAAARAAASFALQQAKAQQQQTNNAASLQRTILVNQRSAAAKAASQGIVNTQLTIAQTAQRSRLISGQDQQSIARLNRRRGIEVAQEQQEQARRTERLRQFNRVSFAIVQTGLARLLQNRRNADIRGRSEQESNLRKEEQSLKSSYDQRIGIANSFNQRLRINAQQQSRITQNQFRADAIAQRQQAGALAAIQTRTQGGVIGALRGTSVIGQVGRAAGLFGLAAGFKAALSAGQDFFGALRRLGALTGATDEQLAQLRQTAIDLGNDIKLPGVSAGDAADAMAALAQTGFTVQQSIDNARAVLALGRTQMIDFGEAARFVGSQVNAFGISAADSIGLIDDATTALVQGGGQSFTELQQAIEQSGSVFASTFKNVRGGAGAFEDLNVALAILAKNALRGSDAGTSLRTFILRLTAPQSKDARKLLRGMAEELNLVGSFAFDAQGKVRPFTEIIRNLRLATKDLNEESRTKVFTEIFGQDAIRAANIFFATTEEGLQATQDAFANNTGTVDRLAEAINKGLKGALDALSSQLETIGILLFEKLERPLTAVVSTITTLIANLVSGGGIFGTIRTALLGASASLGSLLAFKAVGEALRNVVLPAISALTSPLGLLLTGIGALGAAFAFVFRESEPFRDAIGQIGQTFQDTVLPSLQLIGRIFATTVLPALTELGSAFLSIFGSDGVVPRSVDAAAEKTGFFGEVGAGLANFITSVIVPALETFSRVMVNQVAPILKTVADFISGPFSSAVRGIPELLGGLGGVLGSFGSLVQASVSLAVGEIRDTLIPTLQDLAFNVQLGFSGQALGASADGFIGVLQTIAQKIGVVADSIRDIFTGNFDFGGAIRDLIIGAFTGIGDLANFIGRQITVVFSEPVLKALAALAASVAAVAGDIAVNFLIGFVQGMRGRIDDIARVIRDILSLALEAALKAAFSGGSLSDIIVGGLLGAFTLALTGAAAFKLLGPFVRFFKSGGFQTLGRLIKFDISGAVTSEVARADKILDERLNRRAAESALRGTRLGRALIPVQQIDTNVRAAATAINSIPNRIRQLPVQVAGVIGRVQQSFFNLVQIAQSSGVAITTAFVAVGAGISGAMLGAADSATEVITGITGIAGSIATAFAVGGAPSAAIVGFGALVGTAFGFFTKGGDEAISAAKAFEEAFKNAGTTVVGTFASAIQVAITQSDVLRDALDDSRVSAEKTSEILLQQGDRFLELQRITDEINRIPARPIPAGTQQARQAQEAAAARRRALQVELAGLIADIRADTGLTTQAITALVPEVVASFDEAKKGLKDLASNFTTTGDEAQQFFRDMKAAANDADIRNALLTLIPDKVETILADLNVDTDAFLAVLRKGGPDLTAFNKSIEASAKAAGLSDKEIKDLMLLLQNFGIIVGNVATQTDNFNNAQRKIADNARAARIDRIKTEWDNLRNSVQKATDKVDEFFANIKSAASDTSVENFAVNIANQLDTLKAQLAEDQTTFADAIFSSTIIGDQTRINIAQFGVIFRDRLKAALKGVTDPAEIQRITGEQKTIAERVLEEFFRDSGPGHEITAEEKVVMDAIVNTFQLPDEAIADLQEQINAQALTAKINEVIPPDVTPLISVKAVIEAIELGKPIGQLIQEARTGVSKFPGRGGPLDIGIAREGGIWEAPSFGQIYRDSRQRIVFNEPQTGGEAFIPLGYTNRSRSIGITRQVAQMFGYELVPAGQTQGSGSVNLKGVDKFERAIDRLARHRPHERVVIQTAVYEKGKRKHGVAVANNRALRMGSWMSGLR